MKTQKFKKKLMLNKKTVANLNQTGLKIIKAGRRKSNLDNTCGPSDTDSLCRQCNKTGAPS